MTPARQGNGAENFDMGDADDEWHEGKADDAFFYDRPFVRGFGENQPANLVKIGEQYAYLQFVKPNVAHYHKTVKYAPMR